MAGAERPSSRVVMATVENVTGKLIFDYLLPVFNGFRASFSCSRSW